MDLRFFCALGCATLVCSFAWAADTAGGGQRRAAGAATKPATTRPATVHGFTVMDIDGKRQSLEKYKGKVLLIVNVASKCGYTPQYAGLEKLYEKYKDKGLVLLGVPSNDFGKQEPGTNAEIKEFCSSKYGATFPMLSKTSVKNGEDQAPLYRYLTRESENRVADAKVSWNFNKFLVGKDGRVIRHYESKVKPDDEKLEGDIKAALEAKVATRPAK